MGGFLGGLGGAAGAISGLGPTVETLGLGLTVNQLAQMKQARQNAAQKLVQGLPDEYSPLIQAGQASGDWEWALGQVGGVEGDVLRRQHAQQTVQTLMAQNPGMSFQDAAAQAAAQEGDWDTLIKLSAAAGKGGKDSPEESRSFLAASLGKVPPALHNDILDALQPDASDLQVAEVRKEVEQYNSKKFARHDVQYERTEGDTTYKGVASVPDVEEPGDYSSEAPPGAAGGGETPTITGPGSPIGPAPATSAGAGPGPAPPPPPPLGAMPSAAAVPPGFPRGTRVLSEHPVPGPAATVEKSRLTNLQAMGPIVLQTQKAALAIGDGDYAKAKRIWDGSVGPRAVKGFFGQYPGKLGDAMLAIDTFNATVGMARRTVGGSPVSTRFGGVGAEKSIKVSTDFDSLMRVLHSTSDEITTAIQANGGLPNETFGEVKSLEQLQAESMGAGGVAGLAPAGTDIHGRPIYHRP